MTRLVSVDPGLEEVKNYLLDNGFEITDMDKCIRSVEAVVYSGQSLTENNSADCPSALNTVLVNAAGLTPEQVKAQLENRLG